MAGIRGVATLLLGTAFVLGAMFAPLWAQQSPDELERLVAPVALYPDELLAQVLAAATYPADVDAAAQWMQQNATLTSDQIANAVDRMPWDASVKALTEFPLVLNNMERNLSWTSALGDAYFNQPDDVMDAVQALRQRALSAGTLQSDAKNETMTVGNQDGTILIEPTSPDVVYVPIYDCWGGFGAPIDPWPDFVFAPGFVRGPRIVWSSGFHIGGAWGRVNWGWHNWAFDWGHRRVEFRRENYVSHSPTVIDRHYVPRVRETGGRVVVGARTNPEPPPVRGGRGSTFVVPSPKPAAPAKPGPKSPPDVRAARGFPAANPGSPPPAGTHAGAMSGIGHGGTTANNASRGRSSMGQPAPPRPAPPASPHAAPPAPARSAPPPPPPPAGRGRGRL